MNIEELIRKKGILIGSRRWGGVKLGSDWDYAISMKTFKKIEKQFGYKLKRYSIDYENDLANDFQAKVKNNGNEYNLIVYGKTWKKAKKAWKFMNAQLDNSYIRNKRVRIKLCECIFRETFDDLLGPEEWT